VRIVVDTNVLVSALLIEKSLPARILTAWRQGRFEILSSALQMEELARVTRYPWIRARLTPALAGRLVNDLREVATMLDRFPKLDVSPDPYDNYLLAMAQAGEADYLVTGDKRDLLALKQHRQTQIVTVRAILEVLER
jgi:uncharacterized protein